MRNQTGRQSQTRRLTSLVLATVAITAPATAQVAAVQIDARITADNAYRFGYGPGFTPAGPMVKNCSSASEIFSCGPGIPPSAGPEVYAVSPGSSDYLYIVAYDSDSGTQGLLGQFQFGTNPMIYTGTAWEVCAIGRDFLCSSAGPTVAQITTDIGRCNNGDQALTSQGWVTFTTPAPGRLEVGEANDNTGGVFQQVCSNNPNGIDPAAKWIWYDPDPSTSWSPPTTTSPFEPDTSPDGEYLIFRLAVREIPGVCTTIDVRAQYAVKFVCYQASENPLALVRGYYGTAINVHNPRLPPAANERVRPARLAKKVAEALPGETVGRVSPYRVETLGPDQAFEIDCAEILKIAGLPPGFHTGFVVIDSDEPLDVTAIYTGRPVQGQVSAMDVENVPERRMDGQLTVCH